MLHGMVRANETTAASRWDEEYRAGRYVNELPVDFVDVIGAAVRERRPPEEVGLYIGCGNGRNYVPLVQQHKIDLVGLDVSGAAIEQLRTRMPERADRLVHGDINVLPPGARFGTVIGIQVFQHGTEAQAHAHVSAAIKLLLPGGLLCVRVNAVGTQIEHRHEVVETNDQGGFTVRYDDGPKNGLLVHFFSRAEIEVLTEHLTPVSPVQIHRTKRSSERDGHWDQWQGIWGGATSQA
jgi:SAM-dependent methyltransferase